MSAKTKTRDLTSGSVSGSLFLFALPMIAGNLLQQCYNLADTWVIGRYVGSGALSAVGSSYALMTFLNSILIGMCMGSGALFAYYQGKGDDRKRLACVETSFLLLGALALILTVLTELFTNPILRLLQTPAEIFDMMRSYVVIIFVGILFVYLYNYFAFLLRSMGESVVPLVFLGIASALNIGLDLYFVISLNWGIVGAAVATVFAQFVSGVGLWLYTWKKYPQFRLSWKRFAAGEKPVGEILRFSAVSSAQQSIMNFGILMVQGLVNSFGVSVMAAFAAAVKIDTLAYMPAQEFGNAYSIFLSQNFGAGKKDRIKKGTHSAMLVTIVFCLFVSAVVFVLAKPLMQIFVDASETKIISIGVRYLRVEGTFYALIGILFLLYGYFRGINRPEISLLLTIISLGTRVVLAYIGAYFFGVDGIWWSIPIGWMFADVTGGILCRKN